MMSELGINSEISSVRDSGDNQVKDRDINKFIKHGYLWFVNSISSIDTKADFEPEL